MFPERIYLTGFMGSGKSTLGPPLAERLGYGFLDLDAAIEAEAGRPVQALFAEEGEAAFRALERACLQQTARRSGVVVALGGGALTFEENLHFARTHGAVVYLYVPPAELARRLARSRTPRPLLFGEDGRPLAGPALEARIADLLAHREAFYRRAHHTVDLTGKDVDEAVAAVLGALRHHA